VTYYHVELGRHDVLLAEGLPAETYLDTGNGTMFEISGQPLTLHPNLVTGHHGRKTRSAAPFADRPDEVEPLWRGLADRAQAMGRRLPDAPELVDDPDLRIVAGTWRIEPIAVRDGRYTFVLPPGVLPRGDASARLVSRTARPSDGRP
jgi:hypothetical protein